MKKITLAIAFVLATFVLSLHGGGLGAHGYGSKTVAGSHCASTSSSSCSAAKLLKVRAKKSKAKKYKRNPRVRAQFMRNNPCPSTGRRRGACPGYHVDHIKPLACGGADATWNMQWLPAKENLRKGAMGCRRR